ncbi:MAG: PilZ domain-containing protein [Candidatus Omnitrophota bacterium]
MIKERRKSVRVKTEDSFANCRLLSAETDGKFHFAVWPVKDISEGGISIQSEDKIAKGALAFLNIDLNELMKTVGIIGKVVWDKKIRAGYKSGLCFSCWPHEEDKKIVESFVEQKTERKIIIRESKSIF